MLALQASLTPMVQAQEKNPHSNSFQSLIGLDTEQV
jgi:hypothetical protein